MAASFFVVPQWQGSPSTRAMRLADGAHAISRDLPSASTTIVDVPAGAGDALGTRVNRASSVVAVRDNLAAALSRANAPAITIGGDCGVALAAVPHALRPDVAVLWFDAHPDLNTPESSPSGAFTGMVLRTLLGEGEPMLVPAHPLSPSQLVLVGARDIDASEAQFIEAAGIPALGSETTTDEVVEAVAATGAKSVYVHVDLDVLDPAAVRGLGNPVPFGMQVEQVTSAIRAVVSRFPLAGAGISGFMPSSAEDADDDLGTILRMIGALTH
ncbi:arginase family protein [Salinibacterium sp. GXW1014]|uniref:arginase family protein n=1 Tax=Salinibacterium sp. GXW1014 TaxID=3377838 RepID=UPI00383B2C10